LAFLFLHPGKTQREVRYEMVKILYSQHSSCLGHVSFNTQAEILAMVNYETKPEQVFRKEGIAIIDCSASEHVRQIEGMN